MVEPYICKRFYLIFNYGCLLKIDALSVNISFNSPGYPVGYLYLDNVDLEEYMRSHLLTAGARETFRTIVRIICGKLFLKTILNLFLKIKMIKKL